MSRPAEILILTRNTERQRLWTRQLTDCDTRLWQGCDCLPPGVLPDVIVTDGPITPDSLADARLRCRLAAGEVGLVQIGGTTAADVSLPVDYLPRELQLACGLLSQVARLRRDRNRSKRTQRLLRELALSDPLTGLPNRRAWEDELIRRAEEPLSTDAECLALLDLDGFKSINEQLGHVAGDDVLRHIGQRLAQQTDGACFIARIGGDEFGLILDDADRQQAVSRLEAMRMAACAGTPHAKVTASVGFVTFVRSPVDRPAFDRLLVLADQALLSAKNAGRDCCVAAELPS